MLSIGGLMIGIMRGVSLQTAAFYGIAGAVIGMFVAAVAQRLRQPRSLPDKAEDQRESMLAPIVRQFRSALDEGATGLIVVGILLAGAQILVSMIILTGVGVTLSSMIVGEGDAPVLMIGVVVALVCMVMGMGIPTTAAYVLVAATLAPALVKIGVDPLAAHMFRLLLRNAVGDYASSVCRRLCRCWPGRVWGWVPVARRAVMLGAVTYVIPFLFLLYPQMMKPGLSAGYLEAALSGVVFVAAFAYLFGGARLSKWRVLDIAAWMGVAVLATIPSVVGLVASAAALGMLMWQRRRRERARGDLANGNSAAAVVGH